MRRTLGVAVAAVTMMVLSSCEKPTSLLGGASPSEALLGIRASITGDPVAIKRVLPCRQGGSIKVDGVAPDETDADGTGFLTVNTVITPEHCAWTTPQGPIQLEGSPNFSLYTSRKMVRGVLYNEINGRFKGRATWTLGGQTVSCNLNATFRIDLAQPLSPTIIGQECSKFLIKSFFSLS